MPYRCLRCNFVSQKFKLIPHKMPKLIKKGEIKTMCERRKCQNALNVDEQPVLKIENLDKELELPKYASFRDSGFDVRSTIDCIIKPGDTKLIPIGVKIELPVGFEAQVRPRSGLALKHSVTVLNTPGTLDFLWHSEIKVILINHNVTEFRIKRGDRVAQIVIVPVAYAVLQEVDGILEDREGFGSSGVK